MNVTDMLRRITMAKAYEFLDRDPDQNIPRLVDWLEKLDRSNEIADPLSKLKEYADNPGSNWFRLAHSFWEDLDDNVRETLFTNFIGNDNLPSSLKLRESRRKYDCNIPWIILLDSAAAATPQDTAALELSFDEMDAIVEQGKALGTYFYGFFGGEPLARRDELIALGNKHADCVFLVFTDGALVDESLAEDLLRVKNMVPVLRVREFSPITDKARTDCDRLSLAMEALKAARLLFGVSVSYDCNNYQALGSERFFDEMIAAGVKFAWFFTYLPLGQEGDPKQMATAEQRAYMYHQIREFRKDKPLFTVDLWNDGEYMGGCAAGGRRYCHINAGGDVEPGVFTHYSDSNIRSKTLLEAYHAPLFMAYRRGQPFHKNPLRSCPLLDDPGRLKEMVETSGAHSTNPGMPEDVEDLALKCETHARDWAPIAERLWKESRKKSD